MSIIDKLKDVMKDDGIACGDPLYLLQEIKTVSNEVIEIDDSHWLALSVGLPYNEEEDPADLQNCSLDFALFGFMCSEVGGENTRVSVVFQGSGPTSTLREPRHIYWGPDGKGYTFYLPGKAVTKAIQHLEKYFDFR